MIRLFSIMMFLLAIMIGSILIISNASNKGIKTIEGIVEVDSSMSEKNRAKKEFEKAILNIGNLKVEENKVSLSGRVDGVAFHFSGELYLSAKQNVGIEAYVAKMEDKKKHFDVVFFEIKNNYQEDLWKYDESLLEKRTLTMEINKKGGKVYYFEADLDTLGTEVHVEGEKEWAEPEIDYLLYVDQELSVPPTTEYRIP